MRMILTFKLEDETQLNVICDCNDKNSARSNAIRYSQMIFNEKKFILKPDSEVVSFEKWSKTKVTKQSYGAKQFNVAAVANGDVAINQVCAGSAKGAYNNIKYMYGIDGEIFAFIYDIGQVPKKKSALVVARNTMTNRYELNKVLNQASESMGKIPGIGKYAENLKLLFMLMQDYVNGTYKKVPVNHLIRALVIILYYVSPINLSFEAVPIIGQCDDIVLISWFLNGMHDDLQVYKQWLVDNKRLSL